jgi:hypothetical protein
MATQEKAKGSYEADSSAQSMVEKPHASVTHQSADSLESGGKFSVARTKQLLRKMDVNIVPFLSLLYL